MDNSKINVNFDSLKKTGNNVLKYAQNLKSEIDNVKRIADILKDSWQGTDNMDFSNMLENDFFPNFEKLYNTIYKYGYFLIETENEYEEFDNSTKR